MYFQLHLYPANSEDPESLSDALGRLGAVSVTFENAADEAKAELYEPLPNTTPLWDKIKLTALFTDEAILKAALKNLQAENADLCYEIETLADQAWERAWMKDFHPMKFGERTWICPSWCEPPQPTAINLMLDPGLAFGTGTHPTTALCLEWIDGQDFQNKTVIDYGSGSGILSLAALLHGAAHVYAVDYDEQALEATLENATRNHVAAGRLTVLKPEALPALKTDIILANILAEPLIELAPRFAELLKPEGKIVLSGILKDQTEAILDAYAPFFKGFNVTEKEEWVRIDCIHSPKPLQSPPLLRCKSTGS